MKLCMLVGVHLERSDVVEVNKTMFDHDFFKNENLSKAEKENFDPFVPPPSVDETPPWVTRLYGMVKDGQDAIMKRLD
ncbi:hypothetical protein ACOSP7_009722 [Xanthoceras sorbifolium]